MKEVSSSYSRHFTGFIARFEVSSSPLVRSLRMTAD